MNPTNLDFFRGDTKEWDVSVAKDGVAVDLTGGKMWMTVRYNEASGILFQRTSDASDGIVLAPQSGLTIGQATVKLRSADSTALPNQKTDLFYDVHIRTAAGDEWTVAYGTLTMNPEATL